MKRTIVFVCVLCLVLSASVLAKDVPTHQTPKPMSAEIPTPASRMDCQIGNYDYAAAFFYLGAGNIWGNESYAVMVDPDDVCAQCNEGYQLEMVYMMVNFTAEDVPVDFQVRAKVFGTATTPGCLIPGDELAVSDPVTYTASMAGSFLVAIPFQAPCMDPGYRYGIGVEFLTPFAEGQRPEWLFDNDAPTTCSSFGLWEGETQWTTMLEWDYQGDFLIWADMVCCANPVSDDQKSFGDVKSMYR